MYRLNWVSWETEHDWHADSPQLQPAYRPLLPCQLNSQHQSDKLADGMGKLYLRADHCEKRDSSGIIPEQGGKVMKWSRRNERNAEQAVQVTSRGKCLTAHLPQMMVSVRMWSCDGSKWQVTRWDANQAPRDHSSIKKTDFETSGRIYMFYMWSDPRFNLNVQHRNGTN